MRIRTRITAGLAICAVAGPAFPGVATAADPEPRKLWEVYPLVVAETGERRRQTTTTTTAATTGSTAPATTAPATTSPATTPAPATTTGGGVAGVSTAQAERAAAEQDDSDDGGFPIGVGLMLGVAVAAISFLVLAALPSDRGPQWLGELVAARRADMMVAGAFALLFVGFVYFVGWE